MKKTVAFIFPALLAVPFPASAQTDSSVFISFPLHRETGSPLGEKIISQIGPAGGKISSADGTMALQVPAGALASPVAISVQPVRSTFPPGIGNAYQLGPEGLSFQKPAQLVLHYSDTATRTVPAYLHSIYWQDANGDWEKVEKVELDTVHKTITCAVPHFSSYVEGPVYHLVPDQDEVSVLEIRTLTLFPIGRLPDEYDSYPNRSDAFRAFTENAKVKWYVNDIEGGNQIFGTIRPYRGNQTMATYRPPAVIPDENPVEVKAKLEATITLPNGWVINSLTVMSYLTIYAKYHYTFTGISKSGVLNMVDSSGCDIKLDGKSAEVSNIKNYPAWSDWPSNPDGCSYQYTNKDTWKGLVEIWGVSNVAFTGASSTKPLASVNISLVPALGNTPSAIVKCPGAPNANVVPSMPMRAIPSSIQFDIDGNNLIIHYGAKTGTNELNSVVKGEGFIIKMRQLRY